MASLLLYGLIIIALLLVIWILLMAKNRSSKIGRKIKEMMNAKKSIKEILGYARAKRWNEKEAKLYFLLYNFQNFRSKGYKLEEIKSMAEDSGWPKDLVEIIANKLR